MPRHNRLLISEETGGYHIISRTVGQRFLLGDTEKDIFLKILFRFTKAYFVRLHTFCVMGNHFYLLVTMNTKMAEFASEKDIANRYWIATKGEQDIENIDITAKLAWLNSECREKVMERLCSVSRYIGDVKQTFSRYYNKANGCSGHFWSDRFKGILVTHGAAQLCCASYIDLNPVKANLAKTPEQYKWCTLGFRKMNPVELESICTPIIDNLTQSNPWVSYHSFVYQASGLANQQSQRYSESLFISVKQRLSELELKTNLLETISNMSNGIAIGTKDFVQTIKNQLNHKETEPSELPLVSIFTSKVLSTGYS
jgi:REP element-mobilizing transposase RayT